VLLERGGRLVAPKARVGAHQQRARRPEAAKPLHELAHESLGAALALSGSLAHARLQHLAAVGAGSQERVVAAPLRVAEAGALFGLPGDFDDRRVKVDRQRPRARPRPGCPGSAEDRLERAVELAHMPERERAQERPRSRGRHHPVPEHPLRLTTAQDTGVVDRVAADERRADERQQLATRPSRTRPLTEIKRLITIRSIPSRPASVLAKTRPALATARSSSKASASRSTPCPPRRSQPRGVVTIRMTS